MTQKDKGGFCRFPPQQMNFWEFMNFLPLEPAIVPALRFNIFLKVFTIKGY